MKRTPRCQAKVYKRDTYRRTGRGKSGFEMHYTEKQCSRRAVTEGLCRQHKSLEVYSYKVPRCEWASEFMEER